MTGLTVVTIIPLKVTMVYIWGWKGKLESICIFAESTMVEDSTTLSEYFCQFFGYEVVPIDV